MAQQPSLRDEILAVLNRGMTPLSDDEFNSLALRVFNFQFQRNSPYRKYCERRVSSVNDVTRWQDIPAVPTGAFKEARLVSGDPERAQAVFRTSGTTGGAEKRGAHYVLDLELYRASLLPPFKEYVLGNTVPWPMLSLVAPANQIPDSSLSYMISAAIDRFGTNDSRFAMHERGIQFETMIAWLGQMSARRAAVCIVGTSLAFLHMFDKLQAAGQTFALPGGSRIMDTGGFKGSERSITPGELRGLYGSLLGVDASNVINEYGMTEMLSQFYDAGGVKRGPPWVRSTVVDPDTLRELHNGETGLLRHVDLANLFSVSAIQTEDLGRAMDGGFELLGRVPGAAPRGCSIAMDIFLSAAR